MNYNEWNKDQNNIFIELDDLDPNGVIGKIGVGNMEITYSILYGERTVPKNVVNKSTSEIALMLHTLHSSTWNRLLELYEEHKPIGFESETVVDETYIDSVTKNLNNNNVNKVAAFNVDELTENNSNDETLNATDNKDSEKQYTQTKTSLQSIEKQRIMIENSNIMKVICSDVVKVMGLSIY